MDEATARIVSNVMSGIPSHEPGVILIVAVALALSALLLTLVFRVE